MGATWTSWRITISIIIAVMQIPALIGHMSKAVNVMEGQPFDFRCAYPRNFTTHAKYFCRMDNTENHLIRTKKHDKWVPDGRFSLYDNTSAAIFLVRVERLALADSGKYFCGVDLDLEQDHLSIVVLNVSRVKDESNFSFDHRVDKLNMPLLLTVVMCAAAIVLVSLFILCLLRAVRGQRSRPPHRREISAEYETMTLGVIAEPQLHCNCSSSDCTAPPPDLCSHVGPTSSVNEYSDRDAPSHMCHYQHLDVSQLEDHVYQKIHRPKSGRQQISS